MEFDHKKNLHLGAVVGIKLVDQKQPAYMASDGFIIKNVFGYTPNNPFINFNSCLFRICAALPFKSQKKV